MLLFSCYNTYEEIIMAELIRKLFHKDIFMPEGVAESCINLQKRLTRFSLSEHVSDHLDAQLSENDSHTYYKDMINHCVKTLKDNPQEAFEVELTKGCDNNTWSITKYCVRVPCGGDEDLAIVIRPLIMKGKLINSAIITAWINKRDDKHDTLDDSRYCTNPDWYYVTWKYGWDKHSVRTFK